MCTGTTRYKNIPSFTDTYIHPLHHTPSHARTHTHTFSLSAFWYHEIWKHSINLQHIHIPTPSFIHTHRLKPTPWNPLPATVWWSNIPVVPVPALEHHLHAHHSHSSQSPTRLTCLHRSQTKPLSVADAHLEWIHCSSARCPCPPSHQYCVEVLPFSAPGLGDWIAHVTSERFPWNL